MCCSVSITLSVTQFSFYGVCKWLREDGTCLKVDFSHYTNAKCTMCVCLLSRTVVSKVTWYKSGVKRNYTGKAKEREREREREKSRVMTLCARVKRLMKSLPVTNTMDNDQGLQRRKVMRTNVHSMSFLPHRLCHSVRLFFSFLFPLRGATFFLCSAFFPLFLVINEANFFTLFTSNFVLRSARSYFA